MTLAETLKNKTNGLLNIYCTAGYPNLGDLPTIINALHRAGADMVEVGIPYSDPLADGPTIQESGSIALKNGITIEKIFEQLATCKAPIPKILMGYFNPVLQFGVKRFCQYCQETGVEGVILPDLPLEVYEKKYKAVFEAHGISNIFLITPHTSIERIKKIEALSTSFIYAVSSSSTTGNTQGLGGTNEYLEGLKSLPIKCPVLVGFNISTPHDFALVNRYAQGGIIGSAFIRHLKGKDDIALASSEFVKYIKNGVK